MRRLFLLFPVLTFGQVAPEVTTNVQLDNLVFYLDQHGDATKIATLPGLTPTDPQLGFAVRRYTIIADVSSVGGKPAAGTFLAHGLALGTPSSDPQPVPGRPIVDFPRKRTLASAVWRHACSVVLSRRRSKGSRRDVLTPLPAGAHAKRTKRVRLRVQSQSECSVYFSLSLRKKK